MVLVSPGPAVTAATPMESLDLKRNHCRRCYVTVMWSCMVVQTIGMTDKTSHGHHQQRRQCIVYLDTASSANTALTSWRTSTTRMPYFLHPTRTGEICPPLKQNTNFTRKADRHMATKSPPWRYSTAAVSCTVRPCVSPQALPDAA